MVKVVVLDGGKYKGINPFSENLGAIDAVIIEKVGSNNLTDLKANVNKYIDNLETKTNGYFTLDLTDIESIDEIIEL